MNVRSFAKINLGLEVIRKREDGYHEIRTLFQTIDFFDEMELRSLEKGDIFLEGDDPSIPWGEENLIFKAARFLRVNYGVSRGVEIRVKKRIPAGSGLGGGSSNAAATLFALNKLWGLRLRKRALLEIGDTLGSDVPFFLEGGLCLGTGRGEKIEPLADLEPLSCLLVLPSFPIPTPLVYSQLSLTSGDKDSKIIRFLVEKNIGILENRLEETVFRLHPQLKAIKDQLQNLGSDLSLVSGSGSAVFGLFHDEGRARSGLEEMKKEYSFFITQTLSRKSYRNMLLVGV